MVILIFLIILISSISIASAQNIKPVKETKLEDNGVRYTLPPGVTKPTTVGQWNSAYDIILGDGKPKPIVSRWYEGNTLFGTEANTLMFEISGISSKKINKIVLHLENQSFTGNSNKNLNSFTHTFTPEQEKTKNGYKVSTRQIIHTNSPKSGGMTISTTLPGFSRPSVSTTSNVEYASSPNLVAFDIYYAKESGSSSNNRADITISKVTKKGNSHTVFIRNIGKVNAGRSVLGVYDGNKLIKKVNVKAIAKGKTVQVKVTLDRKFNTRIKTFRADVTNKIKESNKNNNIKKVR